MEGNPDLPYALAYKLSCLLCGMGLAYLGYLLFIKGFTKTAGDAAAGYKNMKVTITKGAPGTFFSILGAFVLCFTIVKGLDSHVESPYRRGDISSMKPGQDSFFLPINKTDLHVSDVSADTLIIK